MDNNNQIAEIKDRLDIVQVIGKYVQLKQTGKNFSGLCPFHKEKTPSFMVSPDIQRYKCFGCNESGDIFNFVQKIENLDFPETLEKLAKEAGVELKKFQSNSKYKLLEEINYIATKYYYKQLRLNKVASKYLEDRGFTKASIKTFGVGYAPRRPQLIKEINSYKKITKKEMLDTGLFTEKNGIIKEKFYDRIMFPIRSKKGAVIGFTARILPGNDWGPKYMNTPETPLFHKKDNLFGLYEAKQEIRKQDLAIVCEGSTDVISAHQNGYKNIVAPLGTSLTKEQLQSLSTFTKNILFFFDSDNAGKAALIRAFKLSSEIGISPYATTSLPYKDIDEMLQKDPKQMETAMNNKVEAFVQILNNTIEDKDLSRLEDVNKVRKVIEPLLDFVKDDITRKLYIEKYRKIAKIGHPSKTLTTTGFTKRSDLGLTSHPTQTRSSKGKNTALYHRYLLYIILQNVGITGKDLLPTKYFESTNYHEIYSALFKDWDNFDKEKFFQKFADNPEAKEILEDLIFQATDLATKKEDILEELKFLKKKIKIEYYRALQKNLSSRIAMTEEMGHNNKEVELLKKLEETTKIINSLKNEK
ncbi:MAG: DNA primase [Candidatus Dojkabacteria bacterium]|jgi:DNA primase catalytic core